MNCQRIRAALVISSAFTGHVLELENFTDMREHTSADWDARDQRVLEDQRVAYDDMREKCPVAYSDLLHWSLFRHEDIVDVLEDPTTFSSASRHLAVPNGMDPPEHTHYRRALESVFASERIAAFEKDCQQIAEGLMQYLSGQEDVEIMADYAQPCSHKSLCAFLGWPQSNWEYLRGWTHGNQEAAFAQNREAGAALAFSFTEFVKRELQARRESGVQTKDDLFGQLMATEVEGTLLSDEEIISVVRNWAAGHGTVAASVGIIVAHLAEYPDLQQQLRSDPTLLPSAIDEILRVNGPLVANRRKATRDVEIGGRTISAEEDISLIWIAADRDERVFTDPYEVDLDRDPTQNLLFGHGIHDCVGAPLARLEMLVGIRTLLARTSTFVRNESAPVLLAIYPGNGFQELHVRLR